MIFSTIKQRKIRGYIPSGHEQLLDEEPEEEEEDDEDYQSELDDQLDDDELPNEEDYDEDVDELGEQDYEEASRTYKSNTSYNQFFGELSEISSEPLAEPRVNCSKVESKGFFLHNVLERIHHSV